MALPDLVLPIFGALTAVIAQKTYEKLQWPFIDEFFHLRQCARYCAHEFSKWDNKITTPPGLYLLGTWFHHVLSAIGVPDSCGATALRSLNLFGGVVVLPLVLSLVSTDNFWKVNVLLLPLLYTYYFFFYTDVWATVLVVLPLLVVSKHRSLRGSIYANLAAFASLWLRQTNIVWLVFVGVVLIDKRKPKAESLLQNLSNFIVQCLKDWALLVPFAMNAGLFIAFVFINGGVTFGDKENHKMTLHVVQIFYCATFIAFFTTPVWLSPNTIKNYIQFAVSGRKGLNLLITAALFVVLHHIIKHYTVVHPFLLADNRHYTFYIYRKILSKPWAYLVTIPAYHFSSWVIVHSLSELYQTSSLSLHPISIAALVGSAVATLIPSPLFEPRYYIVPLVIVRIFILPQNERLTRTASHTLEFVWYLTINALFFVVFFTYEFSWLTEPGLQRIIW